jgi:coenzyme PQQ synthesis protein D (PqqD)
MIQRADLLTAVVGEDLIMMSLETGQYHSLTGVGSRIWELLAEPTTEEAIISQLQAKYDVPPDVCASEVTAFLADLRKRGLVVSA